MPLFKSSKQPALGRGGGGKADGKGGPAPAAAAPAPAPAPAGGGGRGGGPPQGAPPQRSRGSPEAIRNKLAEIRENMLQPLGQMLDHEHNEDMVGMVDMYLGEAAASLETVQEEMLHCGDDEVMMAVVALASDFQDLQNRAEAWKSGSAGPPSGHGGASAAESARRAEEQLAEQAIRAHEEAMRKAQEEEAAMLRAQMEADRKAAEEEAHARRMHEEAEQAKRAAAAAAAAAQTEHDEGKRQEDLAEQRRQEEIQRQRQAQADEEERHAREEAARRAAEEEAHARRLQQEAQAAKDAAAAAAQAAALAAGQHEEQKRVEALAEQHRLEELERQKRAQAEEEERHAQMLLARQQEDEQKRKESQLAEAEAMLRETLSGVGRNDLELMEYAVKEAQEAGLANTQHKQLLRDGEKTLSQLRKKEGAQSARLALTAAVNAPQPTAASLEKAIEDARACGLAEEELAMAQAALQKLANRDNRSQELQDAMHDGDPDRLTRAIDQARKGGVTAKLISLGEKHLTAMRFLLKKGGGKKIVTHAWHAVASDIATSRKKLASVVQSPAGPEEIEELVAMAREFEFGDAATCDHALKVAQQRRLAHDQVVCAIVSLDAGEIEAARKAVEAAGGPGADLHRLNTAHRYAEEDEKLLSALDAVLPAAVTRYMTEWKTSSQPTFTSVGQLSTNAAFAVTSTPVAATASAASVMPAAPAPPPVVTTALAPPPVAPVPVTLAPPPAPSPPPTAAGGIRDAAKPLPLPPAAAGGLLGALFGGFGASGDKAPAGATDNSSSGLAQPPKAVAPGQAAPKAAAATSAASPAADAAARHKEMKTKVERARQWVHSQDRAHRTAQGQMPSTAPGRPPTQGGFAPAPGRPMGTAPPAGYSGYR